LPINTLEISGSNSRPKHEFRDSGPPRNTGGRAVKDFVKTTIIGGALFLLPVALVVIILNRVLQAALKLVQPVADEMHLDQLGTVAGIGVGTLLAVLVLILVSFLAGLIARTTLGARAAHWFESSPIGVLPHYRMLKAMAEGFAKIEDASSLKPALVSIEGGWQIGYLLEPVSDKWFAVFLPQAPTPMSGNVMYFPTERVRPLGISMVQAAAVVKHLGIGSGEALRGANLAQPAGAKG
jgi:uncharacterized membrane protein